MTENPFEPLPISTVMAAGQASLSRRSRLHLLRFVRVLRGYRWRHLSLNQRWLLLCSLALWFSYDIGLYVWLHFIYGQTCLLWRVCPGDRFWSGLIAWLPFYCRIWKSAVPFAAPVLAIYYTPFRPTRSWWIIGVVALFTIICSLYDISNSVFDMTSGLPNTARKIHYFTWWWWQEYR